VFSYILALFFSIITILNFERKEHNNWTLGCRWVWFQHHWMCRKIPWVGSRSIMSYDSIKKYKTDIMHNRLTYHPRQRATAQLDQMETCAKHSGNFHWLCNLPVHTTKHGYGVLHPHHEIKNKIKEPSRWWLSDKNLRLRDLLPMWSHVRALWLHIWWWDLYGR
jgi:hypothetical protein